MKQQKMNNKELFAWIFTITSAGILIAMVFRVFKDFKTILFSTIIAGIIVWLILLLDIKITKEK